MLVPGTYLLFLAFWQISIHDRHQTPIPKSASVAELIVYRNDGERLMPFFTSS
jgi:hypothetical protein